MKKAVILYNQLQKNKTKQTKNPYRVFQTIRHTLSPQIWEENGSASYNPIINLM